MLKMCDKVIVRIYMPYLFKTKLNRAYIVNLLFTKPVTIFISSQIILPLFLKIYSDFSVLVFQITNLPIFRARENILSNLKYMVQFICFFLCRAKSFLRFYCFYVK